MPGSAKADVKLGFFVGVGLLLLALVLGLASKAVGKVAGG
jgi:hypothetical protein